MSIRTVARLALGGALLTEVGMAFHRFEVRRRIFDAAARRASEVGRPLVVVGDPDAGMHTRLARAYGCGDLCIDKNGCPMCTVMKAADLTKGPIDGIADDSAVVYVSCVLEYVSDPRPRSASSGGSPVRRTISSSCSWSPGRSPPPSTRARNGRAAPTRTRRARSSCNPSQPRARSPRWVDFSACSRSLSVPADNESQLLQIAIGCMRGTGYGWAGDGRGYEARQPRRDRWMREPGWPTDSGHRLRAWRGGGERSPAHSLRVRSREVPGSNREGGP
jgi:hypothetical protein